MQQQKPSEPQPPGWTSRFLYGALGTLVCLALWEGWQRLEGPSQTVRDRQDRARAQSQQLIRTLAPEIEPPGLSAQPPLAFGDRANTAPQIALRGESRDDKHHFLFLWNERGDRLTMLAHTAPGRRPSATDELQGLTPDEGIGVVRYWLRRTGIVAPSEPAPQVTQHPGPTQWLTYRARWSQNMVQVSLDRRSGQLVHLQALTPGGVGLHPAPMDLAGDLP